MQRITDAQNTCTVKEGVKTGSCTAYSHMGAGLYGLNGISPAISIVLISIFVIPAMMHSLEALILETIQYQILDNSC